MRFHNPHGKPNLLPMEYLLVSHEKKRTIFDEHFLHLLCSLEVPMRGLKVTVFIVA
jgi:hypothetical protein